MKKFRIFWLSSVALLAGLALFAAGGLTAKAIGPNGALVSDEPRWADSSVTGKVGWLSYMTFTNDPSRTPYQKLQNLGPEDQAMLLQAHRLTQGNLRSNASAVTRTVGSVQNANCLQVAINYEFTGTTGLKTLAFPAFHEICYANGQVLSQFTTAAINPNAAAISFWNYYAADAQVTAGGVNQSSIEITVQAQYRLCVISTNVGCVNKANPAYRLNFNAATGSYNITGISVPNPNV